MKKQIFVLGIIVVATVVLFASCTTDSSAKVNLSAINAEISNTKIALDLSKGYNDSLVMAFNLATVKKNNATCIKYDKLYHHNDSLFANHYDMFGAEMYKGGYMMNNYTPGSMMRGGMIDDGMMSSVLRGDTTMMNGYFKTMHQLHLTHQTYHNGIYN